MTNTVLIILALIAIIFNVVFVIWNSRKKTDVDSIAQAAAHNASLQMLTQQLNELSRTVDGKMGDTTKMVQESFKTQANESFKVIKDITEKLTRLDETFRHLEDVSTSLQCMHSFLYSCHCIGLVKFSCV